LDSTRVKSSISTSTAQSGVLETDDIGVLPAMILIDKGFKINNGMDGSLGSERVEG